MSFGGASRKSKRRASKRRSSKRRSGSRKSSRKSTRRRSAWLTFTMKHRKSVIEMLKKKKHYGEGKGQMKLQQDALKEMSKMYKK